MAIARFAAEAGFAPETVSEITVAAGEACNVAIDFATPQAQFQVGCALDAMSLIVSVDYDIPDTLRWAQPANAAPPDGTDVRRLGALLMTQLMDSVDFVHGTDNHARLLLKKALASKAPSSAA